MYINETEHLPSMTQLGVFKRAGKDYFEAWLEVDGTVYDLGRHGNFVDAGAVYLKAKFLLEVGDV